MSQESALNERKEFWDILGGVRFALAMIVCVGHLGLYVQPGPIITQIASFSGPTAVFCFLVISGYSIAASLARDSSQFYRRRVLRIYPLYFLTVLISLVVARKIHDWDSLHLPNILGNLFFFDTFSTNTLPVNPAIWSLAIEAAFYLVAPFLFRRSSQQLMAFAGLSAVAFLIYPWLHLDYYPAVSHGAAFVFLAWAWLAGFIYHRHRDDSKAGVLLLVVMIILTTFNTAHTYRLQHVTIAASIALLVAGRQIQLNDLTQKMLRYLGNISFPLYLIHMPVFRLLRDSFHYQSPAVLSTMAFVAAAIGLVLDDSLRQPCKVGMNRLADECNAMSIRCSWLLDRLNNAVPQTISTPRFHLPGVNLRQFSMSRMISIMLAITGFLLFLKPSETSHAGIASVNEASATI